MIARHVAAVMVVVFRELGQQMIEVSFSKDDEFIQAFQFERLDNPLASAVYICRQLHLIATVRHELFV